MRDGLDGSQKLGSVVQGRGKMAGVRGLAAWVIAGEKQQKRETKNTRMKKKERKRRGTRVKGIRR